MDSGRERVFLYLVTHEGMTACRQRRKTAGASMISNRLDKAGIVYINNGNGDQGN